jgi:lysyl-tRNA synthetase class 2
MSLEILQATRTQKRDEILPLQEDFNLNHFMMYVEPVSAIRATGGDLTAEELVALNNRTLAVGRIMAIRIQGKLGFVDIMDEGVRIQLFVRQQSLTPAAWSIFNLLDIGDHIAVDGTLMRTRAGELSIAVNILHFLNKAVSPLPDKLAGLTDVELRHRMRYLDLVMDASVMERFRMRSQILRAIRTYMQLNKFMEVETPMFHPVSGGANARPFTAHHNALDTDFNLRIAPELYLKRLIVGGYRKVYELNRNFRNEGIDQTHNPEFTMLECYEAYADYHKAMATVETLIDFIGWFLREDGLFIDSTLGEWKTVSLLDLVSTHTGCSARDMSDAEMIHIFETEIESTLITPTIVIDFPTSVSPLAKAKPHDPRFAERFEVYIGGMEIANAFSELTDADEQRRRFEEQVANHADESREIDHDYVRALSHGMPPTAGLGVGIDRLVMLFTGQTSIREVILFPSMRKERFDEGV